MLVILALNQQNAKAVLFAIPLKLTYKAYRIPTLYD